MAPKKKPGSFSNAKLHSEQLPLILPILNKLNIEVLKTVPFLQLGHLLETKAISDFIKGNFLQNYSR